MKQRAPTFRTHVRAHEACYGDGPRASHHDLVSNLNSECANVHTFIRSHIPTAPSVTCNRMAGASLNQCS